ncbi:MAG: hypothetical protein V4449_03200 [Patescibacteria group bacterium]
MNFKLFILVFLAFLFVFLFFLVLPQTFLEEESVQFLASASKLQLFGVDSRQHQTSLDAPVYYRSRVA